MEYENIEDSSITSSKSNSPTLEVHRDPILKSNQNIIILSNEVVQTHLMPNNVPLVIQKNQECSLPQTNQTNKSVEVLQSQTDNPAWREAQNIGCIPSGQDLHPGASQSMSQQSTASAGSLEPQQPAFKNLANQPPIRPQRDVQSHTKTNVIPSDQGHIGKNNFVSTHCKVPFIPGVVRYLSHLPAPVKPASSTEMLPPVSSTKTYSEVTFSSSISQLADMDMTHSGGSSLRTYRRQVVTGKPPDIVISNSKVSGTSSCSQNEHTLISNCYSEEEIMKMPTIIVLPTGQPEKTSGNLNAWNVLFIYNCVIRGSNFFFLSDCENRIGDTIRIDPKIPSGNMAQLLPKIVPATIPLANKSEKKQKGPPVLQEIQPCNITWTTNAPTNSLHTPAEVSLLLPMDISKTEKMNIYFGSHLSSKPKTCSINSSIPVATTSTCNLPTGETNLSSNFLQGMFLPRDTCSSIQSNVSSEDDRFIIDEGTKSIKIEAAPVLKVFSTDHSSQETNTLTTNVVGSQATKVLDQFESKRATTPDLIIGKRTSSSTPRRGFTHVRVLDFNTPPRNSEDGPRQTQSSPKQSLRTHGTTKKVHNLRPKAHNVKSQLFPTIPELPAQGKVEKPRRSRTKSKEKVILPVPVKSTQCKVMKPRRSRTKSKEVAATEESVTKVWDDVQGMGQILKDDSLSVQKSKKSKRKLEIKRKTPKSSESDLEEDKDVKSAEADTEAEVVEDPEMAKLRKAEEAAAEWARIRNIDKRCWDQEMRSIVSISINPPKQEKPKIVKKVRRKITKSTISTSKVVNKLMKDELSKSTEDEGKLLENALNKTQDSECAETPLKDTPAGVIIPKENTNVLPIPQSQVETSMYAIDVEEENTSVDTHDSKHLNTIIFEEGSLPVMEDTSNLPESDNMSNTNYLLRIKLLREARAKNGTDKKCKKPKPDTITRPISHKKNKSTIKVKMNCKNSSDDRSNKEPNIEANKKNNYPSKKGKGKQKEIDSSKDIQPEQLDIVDIETEGEHPVMEAPSSIEVHQVIGTKPKLTKNLEPPIPQVKITPDMHKDFDPYPINAKYNLASLLETPLKCGILDLHLETPKFKISPGFFNEIGLSSALKLLDMPTPNFPTPLLAGLTPRTTAKDCTPGSYSSRPTDYSGSSSYYKPDEIEFDPEHVELVIKTAAMVKTLPANQPKSGEAEKVEEKKKSLNIPQRVLRPRHTPKVYYPPQVMSVTPKNKSLSRNTSSDKPGTSEVKSKKKTPLKGDISQEMYISTDSSSSCSTCSSDDEPIITVPPIEIQTGKYSTSTPISRTDKFKENSRTQMKNSPTKVLKTLQQLEEKRRRVIGKLNSCKGESFKKETKTIMPKKTVYNSQLSLKKITKPIHTNIVKIPSPVAEKKPTTIKPAPSADKPREDLTDLVNCSSNVLAIKSRRKSATPRKLSTDKDTSNSKFMAAEVLEVIKGMIPTHPINTTIKGAEKTDDSKKNILNTQDNMEDILQGKETSVDKISCDTTCSPSSDNCLDLKLHGPNVTHAASDKIIIAENRIPINVPSILLHSPKSSEQVTTEEDLDYITLHLSSDDADLESIDAKSHSESGDITQIRNFIANSSSDDEKTPFQKNLEKEGFDEMSAKNIEKDLTDSVGFDEIFTGECSNKSDILTEQCYNNDSNISSTNGKDSSQDEKSVVKANSSSELDRKSTSKISTHENLEEKGMGKKLKHKEIHKATAYIDRKCSEKYSCNESTDLKIDNEADQQMDNVLLALEICKKDNSQCSVPSVPKESVESEYAALEIKHHNNYTNKLSLSNFSIKDRSEASTKSSSTSKNHYKSKVQSSHQNKSSLQVRNSGIEKKKFNSTNKTSPKSKTRDNTNNLIMSCITHGKRKDSGIQRNNKSPPTVRECSEQLLPKATNEIKDKNKTLPQSAKSTSSENILNPTLQLENIPTDLAGNPEDEVFWKDVNCHSTSKNFLHIVGQEPNSKKKNKNMSTIDSKVLDEYLLNMDIFDPTISRDVVHSITAGTFTEVLCMKPDHIIRRRVQRQEAVALKKEELLISKVGAKRKPLDLLIEEMSKSTHDSPTSSKTNIFEKKDSILKDGEHDASFETETTNAINSILFEAANNVFVYTPVKFLHCIDNVEAACETLTKAIIEDDFVEQSNEDKASKQDTESPPKSDDEDLPNIIKTDRNPTNIIFEDTNKKSKGDSEEINEAMAVRMQEDTEIRQMRKSFSEESEEPLEDLNLHNETREEECSDRFSETTEKFCTNFDESKKTTNSKEFAVKSGEPSKNRNTIGFGEKADELLETSNDFAQKSGESSKKKNPIIVEEKVDGLREIVKECDEKIENINTNEKGNKLMEKVNEKRKRQDSINETDDENAKKIKIDADLFKGIDIESILEKLHGHS